MSIRQSTTLLQGWCHKALVIGMDCQVAITLPIWKTMSEIPWLMTGIPKSWHNQSKSDVEKLKIGNASMHLHHHRVRLLVFEDHSRPHQLHKTSVHWRSEPGKKPNLTDGSSHAMAAWHPSGRPSFFRFFAIIRLSHQTSIWLDSLWTCYYITFCGSHSTTTCTSIFEAMHPTLCLHTVWPSSLHGLESKWLRQAAIIEWTTQSHSCLTLVASWNTKRHFHSFLSGWALRKHDSQNLHLLKNLNFMKSVWREESHAWSAKRRLAASAFCAGT